MSSSAFIQMVVTVFNYFYPVLFIYVYLLSVSLASENVLWQFTTPIAPTSAIAYLQGSDGVNGTVTFVQMSPTSLVSVQGLVQGLAPGWHGLHVYQYGNVSNDCSFVGAHFNVDKLPHGSPTDLKRHAGDLGNIKADSAGISIVSLVDQRISLIGPYSIVGRSLVVNKKADDMGRGGNNESLSTGNSGPAVACGVIAIVSET